MILGIDASNIRSGGAIENLVQLLKVINPRDYGFSRVQIWSGKDTLSYIDDRIWLKKVHEPLLDNSLVYRLFWQFSRLTKLLHSAKCDILFVPGGSYHGRFRPFVAMSQNLLPFEWHEIKRYRISWQLLRNILLYFSQSRTFMNSQGLIFLTSYAQNKVLKRIKHLSCKKVIIPHGVNKDIFSLPRKQYPIENYSSKHPFRLLYVSFVDFYKHQWHVAEAIALLRKANISLQLVIIGAANPSALKVLQSTIHSIDPQHKFISYLGAVPHKDLANHFANTDLFIFASSCETISLTLLEGMASGLPIVCSKCSSMSETLGEDGEYFDPENPEDIARAIYKLIQSPNLRSVNANKTYNRAQAYSWARCGAETFNFLSEIGGVKDKK